MKLQLKTGIGTEGEVATLLRSLISLTRDALICSLLLEGISQQQVRQIVGVDMNRVTRIAKSLKRKES